jgi:hypothetical protein
MFVTRAAVFAAIGVVSLGAGVIGARAQIGDICTLMDGRRGADGCCYLPGGHVDCGDGQQGGGTRPPQNSVTPPPNTQTNTGLRNPCPAEWQGDGDCDEPEGLNLCAEGTDVLDCSSPYSNYGTGPGWSGGRNFGPDTGRTPPTNTATNTGLLNPCPYNNDGDCDEPEGLNLCAEGTDAADCSNPHSNYGSGRGYQGFMEITPGNPPQRGLPGSIQIQYATYGGNCGAQQGNATGHIAQVCNGLMDCRYTIDYQVLGDPAYGCAKDYVVQYTCGSGQPRLARAAPEAGFRSLVSLMCSP